MRRFATFFFLCSLLGCWPRAVEEAAYATNIIDQQVAAWVTTCMQESTNWDEWDECATVGGHIGRLREAALALDIAHGREARKVAACGWFRAVQPLPDVPAVVVAKRSKWRRKCSSS